MFPRALFRFLEKKNFIAGKRNRKKVKSLLGFRNRRRRKSFPCMRFLIPGNVDYGFAKKRQVRCSFFLKRAKTA